MEEIKDHISIIFIHYSMNEERSLMARASLKSLQSTIHTPAEIIVIDNGSPSDIPKDGIDYYPMRIEDSKFFLEECNKKRISMYIRNADNVNFPTARNQGMMNITGNWVAIVDNDIIYKDHWLELCMSVIKRFPDEKRLASPINYPYVHERDPRWRHGKLNLNGRMFNLTERAGSNCLVMKRESMEEIGFFNLDKESRAGSDYTDRWVNLGYLVITPGLNWAYDCGLRRGHNFGVHLKAKRTLSDGSQIELKNEHLWKKYQS